MLTLNIKCSKRSEDIGFLCVSAVAIACPCQQMTQFSCSCYIVLTKLASPSDLGNNIIVNQSDDLKLSVNWHLM